MFERIRLALITCLGILLCLFTLCEVNFPHMQVLSTRSAFVMLGMMLCFLSFPAFKRFQDNKALRVVDCVLAALTVICCGFVIIQSEEWFRQFWMNDMSLGDRAGARTKVDFVLGLNAISLVLETTRRSIGLIVPVLALLFIAHSYYCYLSSAHGWPSMPDWMLPHMGQDLNSIAETVYSQQGIFGIACGVMFKYVFLFVIFGAFLEISGATQFIIDFAEKVFGRSPGGPAKVSVLGSGLMGSLSGSAVANAVTTGAFTIPMMRNAGFERQTAGGITAAAATGGALVPPVMGAGAYMMLELVKPSVTFLQIAKAAVIPAVLYYFSLWMIVHFYSLRLGATTVVTEEKEKRSIKVYDGIVFFAALIALVGLLLLKFTAFRAVTGSLVVILLLTAFRQKLPSGTELSISSRLIYLGGFVLSAMLYVGYLAIQTTELADLDSLWKVFEVGLNASFVGIFGMIFAGLVLPDWRPSIVKALTQSSKNGIALVAASACVGIIIGVVTQTGVAADFSAEIKKVVESSLFIALVGIMCCSIVLGMGVPSVVCYLLMATLMGALLQDLGVIPLGAHLFIFYFGMMSMVTPPVALAAYASASIAKAKIMQTAMAAFRFALVGFTLPYMFIYRPALLLMNEQKWQDWMDAEETSSEKLELLDVANKAMPAIGDLVLALVAAIFGIIALAAGIAGFLRAPLKWPARLLCLVSAAMLLIPEINLGGNDIGLWVNLAGGICFVALLFLNRKTSD